MENMKKQKQKPVKKQTLKLWEIYLKSHCESPDYEDSCIAGTKKEALKIFMKKLGKYGWEEDTIEEKVHQVDDYCYRCKRYFDDEPNMTHIKHTTMCLGCEHVEGEIHES